MPKKLKVVVKSLYSHEIRKDVSLESLKSLKLEDAWPFIRDEIEIEIGSSQLVCIPHITEADLYKCTSLFVPNEKETNGKMFTPLGELINNINKAKSNSDYVKWLEHGEFQDADFKFPHESVKITLQDETIKNKVRVIMVNFARSSVPKDKHLENNIYLDVNNKDLKGKKSVYMITSVLMAKTIEFRVTRGTSSRIFHLGNESPLVFGLDEFLIGDDGKLSKKVCAGLVKENIEFRVTGDRSSRIIYLGNWSPLVLGLDVFTKKVPVSIQSKALRWKKVDSSDHLYRAGKDEACSA